MPLPPGMWPPVPLNLSSREATRYKTSLRTHFSHVKLSKSLMHKRYFFAFQLKKLGQPCWVNERRSCGPACFPREAPNWLIATWHTQQNKHIKWDDLKSSFFLYWLIYSCKRSESIRFSAVQKAGMSKRGGSKFNGRNIWVSFHPKHGIRLCT